MTTINNTNWMETGETPKEALNKLLNSGPDLTL